MAGSDVLSTFILSSEVAAADPDGVCTTQTTSGAGNLTINGCLIHHPLHFEKTGVVNNYEFDQFSV